MTAPERGESEDVGLSSSLVRHPNFGPCRNVCCRNCPGGLLTRRKRIPIFCLRTHRLPPFGPLLASFWGRRLAGPFAQILVASIFYGVSQRSNPQRCGYFGDPTRECHCTPPMIRRHVSKISGPLLDRVDIQIEVPAPSEDAVSIRGRVMEARARQAERYRAEKNIYSNAQMMPKMIRKVCRGREAAGECDCEPGLVRAGA